MDAGAIKAGQAFVEVTATYDKLENNLNAAYSKGLDAIRRGEAARAAYQLEQQRTSQRRVQIGAEAFAAWERNALREGMAADAKRAAERKRKADIDMAYVEHSAARMSTLSSAVDTVAASGRRLAIAGAGVVGALAMMVRGFARTGEDVSNMSQRTGIAVSSLTELNYAARVTQAGIDGLEIGIKRMQKNLGTAINGSKEMKAAFENIGLSVSELSAMAPDQQFARIAASIRGIENPALKTAAVLKIFGKSGTLLLPMINELERLRERAREIGLTMNETGATAGATLNRVFDNLSAIVKRLSNEVGAALAPTIQSLGTRLEECIARIIKFVSQNQSLVTAIAGVGGAALAMGTALTALGVSIRLISTSCGALAKTLAALQLLLRVHVVQSLSATKATMALANALAWLVANPVLAGLAALTAGMAAFAAVTSYAYSRAHALKNEMSEQLESRDASRSSDLSKAARLEQLGRKTELNKDEISEVSKLLKELTGRYGEFGVEVNRVNGSLTVAAGGFKTLYESIKGKTSSDLEKAISEKQSNINKINDQIADIATSFSRSNRFGGRTKVGIFQAAADNLANLISDPLRPITDPVRAFGKAQDEVKELESKRDAEAKALSVLLKRRASLVAGSRGAITGSGGGAAVDADSIEERMQTEEELSKKNADMMADYMRRAHQSRLELIQNEHDKEMALLKEKWDYEQQKATKDGATKDTITQLQKARDAEIFVKRQEYARKQYEEQIRAESEMANMWAAVGVLQGEAARTGMDNQHAETMAAIDAEYNAAVSAAQRKYEEEKRVADLKMDGIAAQRAEERLNAELAEAEAKKRLERAREERRIREANKQILEQTQDVALELGIKQAFGMDSSQGGKMLERARLELERQRAIEEAAKRGEDTESIGRLFDMRKQLLALTEISISTRGGFSAFNWDRQWSGALTTDPGGTLKAKADKIIGHLVDIVTQLRHNGAMVGLQIR